VQLHVRASTVEKQDEEIEEGVLAVCAFRGAYLRGQMDQIDYSWLVRHLKALPTKPHLAIMWLDNHNNMYNRYKCYN
jgi:hypothetical protein